MKSKILIYIIACAGCFTACQKEDALSPSNTPNLFAPQPGATDEESKLREKFYKTTGCHLLFNDTLRHEYKGSDSEGNPFYETELLGLEWELTAVGYVRFKFDCLQTLEQKRSAVDFLENDLFPYIRTIMPYSIIVANSIDIYQQDNGRYTYVSSPLTYTNIRCMALNINQLWGLTQEERTAYAQDICCELIFGSFGGSALYNYADGKAKAFFEVHQYYYNYGKWGANILQSGFLEDPYPDTYPSAKEDAVSYIKACLLMTEEEFWAKYRENDIFGTTETKYNAIKPLVEATGIKFK